MNKKSVLVRDGRHMRPMLAVLERYGIGTVDKYDRGIWITENMVSEIKRHMMLDPTYIHDSGTCNRIGGGTVEWEYHKVRGTNIHNYVDISDFVNLFKSE